MTTDETTLPPAASAPDEPDAGDGLDDVSLVDSARRRKQEVEEKLDLTRAQMQDFNRQAIEFVHENPVACVAAAFGIGFVVGKLASRRWLT